MIIIIGWFFCGVIAAAIGQKKGEAVSALFLGCLLGPLGILFALLSSGNRVACPFCKEKINKAAAICPHCRQELKENVKTSKTTESLSAPSKKSRLPLILGLIILVGVIWNVASKQDGASSTQSGINNTITDRQKPDEAWAYQIDKDTMTQKETWSATAMSRNMISLDFPYSGPQAATLQLRRHPQYGKDIIFRIERGQILCNSYDGCSVLIRFDNQPAERYSAVQSGDQATNIIFIKNYDKFVRRVLKAKTAFVQVPIYQNGNQTLEFNVAGLKLREQ